MFALDTRFQMDLVYTTQMNSTLRARWLASSEVISQVIFSRGKSKMAFVGILSKIKLLVGLLVIQLVWYILKQLFTSVSVKVVRDIYLAASWLARYPPLFTSTSVNNYRLTQSASELSGFTCTSSLTMNEKFQYRTGPPRAVLKISSSLLVNECR